jgi:hypothetical protein
MLERGEAGYAKFDDVAESVDCDREMSSLIGTTGELVSTDNPALTSSSGAVGAVRVAFLAWLAGGADSPPRWKGGGDNVVKGVLSVMTDVAKLSSSSLSSVSSAMSSGIVKPGVVSVFAGGQGTSSDKNLLRDSGERSRDRMLPDGVMLRVSLDISCS